MCDPQVLVWRMQSPWKVWTCDPSFRVWKGVTLESVDVWPQVQGLGRSVTLQIVDMWPQGNGQEEVTLETVKLWVQLQGLGRGHPRDCGCVTPGTVPGRDQPGGCSYVILGIGFGRVLPCRLWKYDPRCIVWCGGVTLEIVEVWPQVQGLGWGHSGDSVWVTNVQH